ncbi:hypothetical protein QMZ92_29920 [Streptomyces sp. HNM0645]|uniref:hypothetical protein n=1 Tax=Streptomyces sp. HNM0645 TaxID=2782343 RepID=UPI0024B8138A|nr:hypothetical protein [Streptomyces sp. HNM0645]MDI9888473.1 hypothetical protein [Streptomyces sp. HNM0645]
MIAGDPARRLPVQHIGAEPEPQHHVPTHPVHHRQPQHRPTTDPPVDPVRVELGFGDRPRDRHLPAQGLDGEVPVLGDPRHGVMGVPDEGPPRGDVGGNPARQRRSARGGNTAGDGLVLTRQHRQHTGMGREHQ